MTFESKFSEHDIERILAEYREGADRKALCGRYGLSVRTLFRWQAKSGMSRPSLLALISSLRDENTRLRATGEGEAAGPPEAGWSG